MTLFDDASKRRGIRRLVLAERASQPLTSWGAKPLRAPSPAKAPVAVGDVGEAERDASTPDAADFRDLATAPTDRAPRSHAELTPDHSALDAERAAIEALQRGVAQSIAQHEAVLLRLRTVASTLEAARAALRIEATDEISTLRERAQATVAQVRAELEQLGEGGSDGADASAPTAPPDGGASAWAKEAAMRIAGNHPAAAALILSEWLNAPTSGPSAHG